MAVGTDHNATLTGATVTIDDLLTRCETLVKELDEFRAFVTKPGREDCPEHASTSNVKYAVDIRQFHAPVLAELKSLQKLAEADQSAEKTIHTLRSSNLPFYEAIWEAAKASQGLVTFHKRFYWDNRPTRDSKKSTGKRCALVDIVARDGEEWIKVSTVSEGRLLFELAKAHWEAADSSTEEEIEEEESSVNGVLNGDDSEEELDRLELIKTAHDLLRASKVHRIHYRNPRIRFILPKISDPPPHELALLLDRIRSTGATVDLGPQLSSPRGLDALRRDTFPRLLPSPHPPLTDTLNIDCTILLALVSDLSHTANHPILPGYNEAIKRQIGLETREHLLPSSLWPAMANKDLVCTEEAATRMREIVDTIGMPDEKARTELVLPNDDTSSEMAAENGNTRRKALQQHSDYSVPLDLRFPVSIVPSVSQSELKAAIGTRTLPPIAEQISEQLTDINRSVFMYGWVKGISTVSSNRTVAKWIEATVEKEGDGGVGPEIWLREPARSLLGKEKERRK